MTRMAEDTTVPCYYCGLPATCTDHVIPLHLISKLADLDAIQSLLDRRRWFTVDACRECNSLLGGLYFDTLSERGAFVKRRIASRHRRDLQTPDWPARDLMEMAPLLRDYILGSIEARNLARARLQWEPSSEPGRAALRVLNDARARRKTRRA